MRHCGRDDNGMFSWYFCHHVLSRIREPVVCSQTRRASRLDNNSLASARRYHSPIARTAAGARRRHTTKNRLVLTKSDCGLLFFFFFFFFFSFSPPPRYVRLNGFHVYRRVLLFSFWILSVPFFSRVSLQGRRRRNATPKMKVRRPVSCASYILSRGYSRSQRIGYSLGVNWLVSYARMI